MDVDDGRPALTALVGFYCHPFGLIRPPRIVSLEDAVDFQRFGFTVMVDPSSEADLATWERHHRWEVAHLGRRRRDGGQRA